MDGWRFMGEEGRKRDGSFRVISMDERTVVAYGNMGQLCWHVGNFSTERLVVTVQGTSARLFR
jgi:hypothetical protein